MMATPNRLDEYLQRVCRSLGGQRAMRDHVRQELREHLLDAAAEHRAAGLSEEAALEKALAEFGEPDAVRSELEATHGHRALAVVIDKAMGWKEKTMKARWLWSTWTHVTVIAIVVLEILFCWFSVVYLLPKFKKIRADGMFVSDEQTEPTLNWIYNFFNNVQSFFEYVTTPVVLVIVALWALFEWRFRGENKSFIRLSALGTVGAGLALIVVLMGVSMVIPFMLAMPAFGKITRPWAVIQAGKVDSEVAQLKQAVGKPDWEAAGRHAKEALEAMIRLGHGPSLHSLSWTQPGPRHQDIQESWTTARQALEATRDAVRDKDAKRVEEALATFRTAFEPIRLQASRGEK